MASIQKIGNSYKAQVVIGTGKERKRKSKRFEKKKDAVLWANRLELENSETSDVAMKFLSFPEYFEQWFKRTKVKEVRESTINLYNIYLKIIRENFNHLIISSTNDIQVQKIIDKLGEEYSRNTMTMLVSRIKACLRDAYARGCLIRDFSPLIKVRGKVTEKRNKSLSISEYETLKRYLLQNLDEFNIVILTAMETGML